VEHSAKAGQRARILLKAFKGGVEERLSIACGIIRRLPLTSGIKYWLRLWARHRIYWPPNPVSVLAGQRSWDRAGRKRLQQLLGSDERIAFPKEEQARLSLILVFYNKAHLSVLSLASIAANADVSCEVVIVDNGSTDDTARLLERVDGAKIMRNQANVGFARACMQAAETSQGEFLCFFNNDALLQPNALSAALLNFEDPSVGVVGGKILLANGDLQEAGSIVWADGTALGYGRGDNPGRLRYHFRRPVDYCSAAFLFTPRRLFLELEGFSLLFSPAYYEDTDYCLEVWERNLRVLYEPRAIIRHYEFGSSKGEKAAKGLMAANRVKFREKWKHVLLEHSQSSRDNLQFARVSVHSTGLRVLYIDDRIPHRHLGRGFPRSNDILSCLAKKGHHVTCAAFRDPLSLENEYADIVRDVELFDGVFERERLFSAYLPNSDLIWVSRPHNMAAFLHEAEARGAQWRGRLVYDAEAIFADRERLKGQIAGHDISTPDADSALERELSLAKAADAVVVVSERDRCIFLAGGIPKVYVIGHRIDPWPTPAEFNERRSFLFVGAMTGKDNPNADSMLFFCSAIWPHVREATGAGLVIAGHGSDAALADLKVDGIRVVGHQENLTDLYNQARVFVVPTRYAAGIPYKAHEAAAFGVPLVVSTLIAEQLGWKDQEDCLVASSPVAFAEGCCRLYEDRQLWKRIRSNALVRVTRGFNEETFANGISSLIAEVTGHCAR
jgi:GT2 family glycosyltransferase